MSEKLNGRGLEVLLFPCNQFGGQEPGSNSEVKAFAEASCPGNKFRMFSKIDVNGEKEAPLFTYLKKAQGGGLLGDNIPWNFGKFLVDRQGKPVKRFGPQEGPSSFQDEVLRLI